MDLTIGMTIYKSGMSKSGDVGQQKYPKQAYSNNVFSEFSKESSEAIKSASISKTIYVQQNGPSFKGSTTA